MPDFRQATALADSLEARVCRNDPVNNVDPLGLDPAFTFGATSIFSALSVREKVRASKEGAPIAVAAAVCLLTDGAAAPVLAGWGLSGGVAALAAGALAGGYGGLWWATITLTHGGGV